MATEIRIPPRYLLEEQQPVKLNRIQSVTREQLKKAITRKEIILSYRKECICGGNNTAEIARIDRFGLSFHSHACMSCGVIFTSPYIAAESIAEYYQIYYHPLTYGTMKTKEFLFAKGQGIKIFHIARSEIRNKELTVFELGAGSGSNLLEFTKEAKKHGFSVHTIGLEFNDSYVAQGRAQGVDIRSLPLNKFTAISKEKYDVIILSHVLEHFTDIQSEIDLLKRLSHSETIFYVEVPGVIDLKTRYTYNCDFLQYLTHAHTFNFSLNSLTNTLNRYGLELISGNEKIESLFRIGKSKPVHIEAHKNYEEIITYLNDLENNLLFYQSKNPANSLFGRVRRKAKELTEYLYGKM